MNGFNRAAAQAAVVIDRTSRTWRFGLPSATVPLLSPHSLREQSISYRFARSNYPPINGRYIFIRACASLLETTPPPFPPLPVRRPGNNGGKKRLTRPVTGFNKRIINLSRVFCPRLQFLPVQVPHRIMPQRVRIDFARIDKIAPSSAPSRAPLYRPRISKFRSSRDKIPNTITFLRDKHAGIREMEESNNGKNGVLDSWIEKIVRSFVIRGGRLKLSDSVESATYLSLDGGRGMEDKQVA